ncbi:MAG: multidrug ABC transporter [Lachnospiraceae bacterium]|nr:multidrug ABC transporter [Lachnospiraceae bacterium]MCI9132698.1 multidrug ABC transporter [Lachnospiraceae bacterium]
MNKYMILLLLSVLVAAFSQILLKKSARITYDNVIREYVNPYVIVGYAMMVGSTLLTVAAYTGLDYKNGPVIEALGFPLVMVLGRVYFGEKLTPKKLLGNALILVGILVFYS